MKKVFIIIVIALVGLAGYYACSQGYTKAQELVLSGNVDIRSVNVSFRVSGRLAKLTAEEGNHVKKGELLGELDAQPYEIAVRQAEQNIRTAQAGVEQARCSEQSAMAALQLLESGYREEEIAKAAAELAAQEVLLLNAEKEYNRMKGLIQASAISEQTLDAAEREYLSRRQLVEASRAVLSQLQAGYRKEEIEKARAQLATASAGVKEAEARLGLAETQLEQAQLNLEDTRLVSPDDGILMTRALEPGAMVASGATVFTLSLRKPIRVRAWVDAVYLGKVHLGQKVRVTDDSGQQYEGTISFISPQAEFTPKTVETADIRTTLVYRIQVTIPDGAENLNAGAPVFVFIPQ